MWQENQHSRNVAYRDKAQTMLQRNHHGTEATFDRVCCVLAIHDKHFRRSDRNYLLQVALRTEVESL